MCHHHFTNDRLHEADRVDEEEPDEPRDDLIAPLEEAEPDEDVELLTDGSGDEDE